MPTEQTRTRAKGAKQMQRDKRIKAHHQSTKISSRVENLRGATIRHFLSQNSDKMHLGAAIIALILCVTLVHCEAQVTFSAGWNPGKRNANAGYVAAVGAAPSISSGRNVRPTIKSITAVCHLLLNQIHELANCEASKYDAHGQDADNGLFEQINK